MNIQWVLFHLLEAKEELNRTIEQLESGAVDDQFDIRVGIEHLYHHLNTAWNSLDITNEQAAEHSEADFYKWQMFPTDFELGA